MPADLSHVATFLLRALRESTLEELHGSFSGTQDLLSPAITSTLDPFAAAEADSFSQRFGTAEAMP